MSEMTATRIGAGTLIALWIAAALVLWRSLPPAPDAEPWLAPFGALDLARAERHDSVLRLLVLGSLAAQLTALVFLAWRRPRLWGGTFVRAASLGALAAVVLQLARLPFGAATLWWQRRYGVSDLGYGTWLVDRLGPLAVRAGLLAFAAVLCLWLARRLGGRWWLAALPVFALAGVVVVLAHPLLTPRLEPVRRPGVVAQVERLAAEQGLDRPEVEVRRTRGRTRQISAEALGIGPTTRVILWGTALELPYAARGFLVAHELAHVSRDHLRKGLAWFVLLLVPGIALLALLTPLRDADDVPRGLLTAFALLLLATPLMNALSRRYEAQADAVALETTHDPRGGTHLFVRMAGAGVRDPDPPGWWQALFATHPSLAERAGAVTGRGGRSPGGS
jgi:STE24 endopeptidase